VSANFFFGVGFLPKSLTGAGAGAAFLVTVVLTFDSGFFGRSADIATDAKDVTISAKRIFFITCPLKLWWIFCYEESTETLVSD